MPGVEDNRIAGRIEHAVQRHGSFNDTEVWLEMAASTADHVDEEGPDFAGKVHPLCIRQRIQRCSIWSRTAIGKV